MKYRNLLALLLGNVSPEPARPTLTAPLATTKAERQELARQRQQKNRMEARRARKKSAQAKNRPMIASRKGFVPRLDGGLGDGKKK